LADLPAHNFPDLFESDLPFSQDGYFLSGHINYSGDFWLTCWAAVDDEIQALGETLLYLLG